MAGSQRKRTSRATELPTGPPPKAVVSRLSLYLRELQHLIRNDQTTVSSTDLGQRLGFSDAQVRKDLAYFGQFGYPGIGYRCQELHAQIKRIMGTDRDWPVALVGLGNLGRALLGYKGFGLQRFQVVAVFDADARKIGRMVAGVAVHDPRDLPKLVKQHDIRLGIIAVPAESAQDVAEQMVSVGIEGILNFAAVRITVPPRIRQASVDLAIELEQLSFAVVNGLRNPT